MQQNQQTFQKVSIGRNYTYYEQTLEWCRIFLSRKSFTSFKGSSLAFAILFPMEEIFEAYIAHIMKKSIPDANVSAQDKKYSLFDRTNETKAGYRLRPDLVVRFEDNRTTIADTKWKVLDSTGPSQTDLYQMYAYYTRYRHKSENVDKVVLIYPYSSSYSENEFRSTQYSSEELGSKIQVRFVDLLSGDIGKQLVNFI